MSFNNVIKSISAALLLFSTTSSLAAECSAKSGDRTIPLLELYTSEGCSSCPPADKWVSKIKQGPDQVTPLAFHVDYWDYIGWKDQFSKAEYSNRQRKIAAFNNSRTVYTPQLVFNGHDFRGWSNRRLSKAINKQQAVKSPADLSLTISKNENGAFTLKTAASKAADASLDNADIFVALYENGLVTEVKAGENAGRKLKHDYVVRDLFGAYQLDSTDMFSKQFTLSDGLVAKDAGAVIFVQNANTGKIVQSLALPFCK